MYTIPTPCPRNCGSTFTSSKGVALHVRRAHSKFRCEICNKLFRNQGAKKTHMKTHEAERGIKCAICGKTCLDQVGLGSHQSKNTKCLEMAANMESGD